MKKILLSGSLAFLALPALAFAAFDDVSLTTSAVISAGGVTLNVSGTTAAVQSITVNASDFSFTLLSGSSLQITSATGQYLNTNADGTYIITDTCSGGTSVLKFASSANTTTITVTPSSTTACSGAATRPASADTTTTTTSSGGNGAPVASGGGGGSSNTSVAAPAITVPGGSSLIGTLQGQVQALLAKIAALKAAGAGGAAPSASAYANANANASFKRDLTSGSKGDDVKALQVWLNAHGYIVAKSGAGSSGNETTKFGGATRAALKAFQKSVGIKPASGYLGAKTRAYISAHP